MKQIALTGVGADVEVFLQDRKSKEIISAEGMIQGTKDSPFIFDDNPHFATSLDNVLAEFGIPPATNKVEFYNYLRKGLQFINNTIPKEFCAAPIPAAELDPKYLNTRQALKFGCEPDYNAYRNDLNPIPRAINKTLRSAGGHIHIGYEDSFDFIYHNCYVGDEERRCIVFALDLFLGVPSVIFEPDNKRKELYGKAGAYRPKVYGLEYRTISNFYLQSKTLTYWVYDAVIRAISWLNSIKGDVLVKIEDLTKQVEDIINSNKKPQALNLIEEYNLVTNKKLKLLL